MLTQIIGGGVIILGEQAITYVSTMSQYSLLITPTLMTCWDQLNPDGSSYLLSDYTGKLFKLDLKLSNGVPHDMTLESLGTVCIFCRIQHLSRETYQLSFDTRQIKLRH